VNIHEYISSGILEAYALGELSEKERSEVEKNLAQYPELRKELALVEAAQEALLMQGAIKPRAAVKAQLFAKISASQPEAKVVPMDQNNAGVTFWKWAAAASVSLAIISSYLAYNYRSKLETTQSELQNMIALNQRMAQDYNQVNDRLDKFEQDLKITNDPSFQRIVMAGTPNAPDAKAYVYWNTQTREVYLSVQNMKALAQNNQYQLWAIIDGKPVDAGVFDGNLASGLVKMKDIGAGAAVFAVTIEPRGGKESPTLETMQVAGNVVKG
jgi:anti-sigma-K factor RskA